jgi:uncharacterized protein YuzE
MSVRHKNIINVKSERPPVVELDSASHAAYIRFSDAKVNKTHTVDVDHCLVTMDTDDNGDVVGVELLGVVEFGVQALMTKAGISGLSPELIQRTRYVPANAEPVAV